jgi:N-acetylmuramoyl-L-alanine amidase
MEKKKRLLYIIIFIFLGLVSLQAQKSFTVVIDAGHGGKDPGAIGSSSKEKAINLAVALRLGTLIEQNFKDVKVIYTRKNDVFIALDERANIANRNKADLFISIHVNSVKKGKNVYGAETYTLGLDNSSENLDVAMRENAVILMEDNYLEKYEGFDPKSSESYIIFEFMQSKHMEQSIMFASEVQKYFKKSKRNNRGVRQAGLLVLRKTSMPAVLVETGFISNPNEEKFMNSKNGQNTLALSIYNAFNEYKKDYDRKLGNIRDIQKTKTEINNTATNTNTRPAQNNEKTNSSTTKPGDNSGVITYKIQILTSDNKISVQNRRFKGYKDISYYVDNGIYKYTYGDTGNYQEILKLYRKAAKDFKGAFIIRMKDGKRINN